MSNTQRPEWQPPNQHLVRLALKAAQAGHYPLKVHIGPAVMTRSYVIVIEGDVVQLGDVSGNVHARVPLASIMHVEPAKRIDQ
jgi:hypothetical protein